MELSNEAMGIMADIDMEFSDVILTGKMVQKIIVGKKLAEILAAANPLGDNTYNGSPVEVNESLPELDHQFVLA